MNSKLVIFDGNAIMYRAFHALPPLTSKDGVQINALYGLVSMLINIIRKLSPTHIIFVSMKKKNIQKRPTYYLSVTKTRNSK